MGPEFAFIDVGVSRAKASTALKTLLASDLGMHVDYVATERPEAVRYAHVTLLGDRAERIRRCLSSMISSKEATREVTDWHCVVGRTGKISSVAYSYSLLGNEVWESYFMGRTFMVSGEKVEFYDPKLNEMLAPDVRKIEDRIDLEKEAGQRSQPARTFVGRVQDRKEPSRGRSRGMRNRPAEDSGPAKDQGQAERPVFGKCPESLSAR